MIETTAAPTRLADPAAAVGAADALVPQLAERAAAHDRAGVFPEADYAALRDKGLMGLMVPPRLGGPGATFADYAQVAMRLAAGNGATALIFNMHASVTGALAQTPDDLARALGVPETYFAMRDRVLTAAVNGALYAVAMSERGAGSRLSAISTTYAAVDEQRRIVDALGSATRHRFGDGDRHHPRCPGSGDGVEHQRPAWAQHPT
ncbi:MAG: acyl-CoA dehydrogenase family protein, partial [Actinomycetota bacterium]|nr:acyl-CoA dehydrogenase family protein [Actinomycetota bacterium]